MTLWDWRELGNPMDGGQSMNIPPRGSWWGDRFSAPLSGVLMRMRGGWDGKATRTMSTEMDEWNGEVGWVGVVRGQ